MKIVINCDLLDTNAAGTKIYLTAILKELAKTAWRKEILCLHKSPNPFFASNNLSELIVPDKANIPGYSTYRLFYKIPRLIKKLNPKAVWEPSHFGPFRLPSRIKQITTIHDLSPITHPKLHTFMGSFPQRLLLPKTLERADVIISPSHFTKKEITRVYPQLNADKIQVIHLAPQSGLEITKNKQFLVEERLSTPYLLMVATLEPRKDHRTLIRAFETLSHQYPELSLVLAGTSGWKNKDIKAQIKQSLCSPKIRLVSSLTANQLSQLYSHCLVAVSTSSYEGFGLPVLEAMRLKVPVVSSNIASHREIGQKSVVYFDSGNDIHLSNKINQLLTEELNQKTEAAYKRSLSFSWSKHVASLQEIFSSVCN